jgi:phospholipid/cholesterol/gamma-HCH transport system substrate-binding protein
MDSMLGTFKNLDLMLDLNFANWSKQGDSTSGINIDLIPSRNYWYSLALNRTPNGKTNIADITTIGINNGLTKHTKDTMTTTNQAFTVSAQFAKRLAEYFVLTGGIIENSGGVSIEFRSLNDKFRLGVMGYDFNRRYDKSKPRYRITSSYQFYNEAYVQMGMQDIANPKLRTFYFGGGLRWSNDDLKKIIGIASSKK